MTSKVLNPECAHNKHRNCDGIGLDLTTDKFIDCPCECHRIEYTRP